MIPALIAGMIAASTAGGVTQQIDCREVLYAAVRTEQKPQLEAAFGCYTKAIGEQETPDVDMLLGHRLAALRMLDAGDARRDALEQVIDDDFQAAATAAQDLVLKYTPSFSAEKQARQNTAHTRVYAVDKVAAHLAYGLGSSTLDPTAVPGFDQANAGIRLEQGEPLSHIIDDMNDTQKERKDAQHQRVLDTMMLIRGNDGTPGLGSVYTTGTVDEFRELGSAFLETYACPQPKGREL